MSPPLPLLLLAFPFVQDDPIVITTRAERVDLVRQVRLPASVLPFEEALLIAHVTGYASSVSVREGDWVDPSRVLVEIDVPLLAEDMARLGAAVGAATANLKEAQSQVLANRSFVGIREASVQRSEEELNLRTVQFQRVERLHQKGAATDEELDTARGEMLVAKARIRESHAALEAATAGIAAAEAHADSKRAALAVSQADLAHLRAMQAFASVRSPFERALVVERHVDRGALIESMKTPLLRVMDIERVRVRLSVDERDAIFVRPGNPILLTPDAKGLAPIAAKVTRVTGALDPMTRRMDLEVDLDNKDRNWMPGMFVHADLDVFRHAKTLTIPARALRTAEGKHYVWTVAGGKLVKSPVEIGVDDGLRIEIVSGLETGAEVVVSSGNTLRAGDAVRARANDAVRARANTGSGE